MSETELLSDNHSRRLADIEKRLARLERSNDIMLTDLRDRRAKQTASQWCECGRDVCRWPARNCPTHRKDGA